IGDAVVRPEGCASRWAAAGWAVWFYAGQIVWPANLTLIYPRWMVDPRLWLAWLPDAGLLAAFATSWHHRQRWGRAVLFGLGYFLVMLLPVLGLVDIAFMRHSLVADHWQYFAMIGVIALVVAAVRVGRIPLVVCAAGVCGWLSWQRGELFREPAVFWSDNIHKNPSAFAAHYNLGLALENGGAFNEAIMCYRAALRLKPDYELAENNLGAALLRSGRADEAVPHFREALRQRPAWAEVHNNIGLALEQAGQALEAIRAYREALRCQPDFFDALNNLGNALTAQHDLAGALAVYEHAVQSHPDLPEAHFNLANTLLRLGQRANAVAQYREALRLQPGWPEAERNLKLALTPPTQ
ncbi:MAG: tetratricopeptide repeat protein, partial [Verrucomicrobia bacterium]|nr:tetratricopeptide repeat protein [Verrucomicrobiota bacterium]